MKKVLFGLIYVSLSLFAIVYATTSVITSSSRTITTVSYETKGEARAQSNPNTLKLVSLNIAHGRKKSFHQITLKKAQLKKNLEDIANFIKSENPTLVALQEADGPSFWSQNFNHVKYLAHYSGFRYSAHGMHVDGAGVRYGTAILSQLKPNSAYSYTFNPTPPTFAKGFTVVTANWPGQNEKQFDFISVHLDYLRESVRSEQIKDLVDYVNSKQRPFIIMGDFNIDWSKHLVKFEEFKQKAGIKTYQIEQKSIVTFPSLKLRLDWIFVSAELEIKSHRISKNVLSDHYALSAEVGLKALPE